VTNASPFDNIAIGANAFCNMAAGTENIAIGNLAGVHYTAGSSYNIVIGATGLQGESNAIRIGVSRFGSTSQSIALGSHALVKSKTNNIAIGSNSLTNITTGNSNIAIGHLAGSSYKSFEASNICIGSSGIANEENSIRIGLPFFGDSPVNKLQKIAIGAYALNSFTSRIYGSNLAIGAASLQQLTTGLFNIALGDFSGSAYIAESNNICIGATGVAGENYSIRISNIIDPYPSTIDSATQNIAIGVKALQRMANTTSKSNIAIGSGALANLGVGEKNIAIGDGALGSQMQQNNNIAIGAGALATLKAGRNNIAIGVDAGIDHIADDTIFLGDNSHEKLTCPATMNSVYSPLGDLTFALATYQDSFSVDTVRPLVVNSLGDVGSLKQKIINLSQVPNYTEIMNTTRPGYGFAFIISPEIGTGAMSTTDFETGLYSVQYTFYFKTPNENVKSALITRNPLSDTFIEIKLPLKNNSGEFVFSDSYIMFHNQYGSWPTLYFNMMVNIYPVVALTSQTAYGWLIVTRIQ